MLNLAHLHEAIAAAIPERECLVFRDRRLRWHEVTARTRRLASVLRGAGLGCHTPRSELERWQSGQDAVALYLYNGNEYLEGMLGAMKARCVPVNVNYRYVEDELLHVFRDADVRAIVFHAEFAPRLARLREQLPQVRLWLEVADDSGESLPGAVGYEEALAAAEPAPPDGLSPNDLYVLYTGGTTGLPKGVLWRQQDVFRAALAPRSTPHSEEALVARARGEGPRALPAPPFMHGAAHWVAFSMWYVGGTVIVPPETRRFDPHVVWQTVERERVTALSIVGDAFARPLLDALAERDYDLDTLRLLTSGGAILSAATKAALQRALPQLRILDALGSSESGQQAQQLTRPGDAPVTGEFALHRDSTILREDLTARLAPGSSEVGWLARSGPVPLGYLGDPEKTRRTFPVVEGVRYAVPGDRARFRADGTLQLLGRDSVTINSGGEKIFAEEVEAALKQHPAVFDAIVVGTPHPRFGQQVTAVVQLREGEDADDAALAGRVRERLAGYKVPRAFVRVGTVVRAPSGKPDYAWARETALAALGDAR